MFLEPRPTRAMNHPKRERLVPLPADEGRLRPRPRPRSRPRRILRLILRRVLALGRPDGVRASIDRGRRRGRVRRHRVPREHVDPGRHPRRSRRRGRRRRRRAAIHSFPSRLLRLPFRRLRTRADIAAVFPALVLNRFVLILALVVALVVALDAIRARERDGFAGRFSFVSFVSALRRRPRAQRGRRGIQICGFFASRRSRRGVPRRAREGRGGVRGPAEFAPAPSQSRRAVSDAGVADPTLLGDLSNAKPSPASFATPRVSPPVSPSAGIRTVRFWLFCIAREKKSGGASVLGGADATGPERDASPSKPSGSISASKPAPGLVAFPRAAASAFAFASVSISVSVLVSFLIVGLGRGTSQAASPSLHSSTSRRAKSSWSSGGTSSRA